MAGNARVSQVSVEVLGQISAAARVSQLAVEVLCTITDRTRVTQLAVEVLGVPYVKPIFRPPQYPMTIDYAFGGTEGYSEHN